MLQPAFVLYAGDRLESLSYECMPGDRLESLSYEWMLVDRLESPSYRHNRAYWATPSAANPTSPTHLEGEFAFRRTYNVLCTRATISPWASTMETSNSGKCG